MKKTLLLLSCALFVMGLCGPSRVWATDDPGDKFLEAYFLIQEGDSAEHQSDWTKASAKYTAALDILGQVKSQSPDWNPHIIEFRTKYLEEHLAALKKKLAPPAPPQPQPTTPAPVTPATRVEAPPAPATPPAPTMAAVPAAPVAPAPAVENEHVKQLTSELQRAREQIKQLETARDDLNTKLQEQLSKVAPTQTTPQIEALLKTNQELAAKLAAAQTQIAEARERAAAVTPPTTAPATPAVSPELEQLRAELAQARGDLQRTKEELQQTRSELGTTKQALEKAQADNTELRRSYDEIVSQLTDANKKLSSARAAGDKDDEIIRQLRKENALLRIIAERKASAAVSPAEGERDANRPSIPELRGWRPRSRAVAVAKERAKPEEPMPQPSPSAMEESGRGKLVATLTAPKQAEPPPQQIAAVSDRTRTNVSAKPVVPEKKTPTKPSAEPKKQAATKTNEQPAVAPAPPLPPDERQLLNEARAALALRDLATAATKYTAVLDMDPTNIVALSSLGAIRYQQNRFDDAEVYLRKAVAAAPNDSNTRSLLGVVSYRKGLVEDSFNELTRAVALDPHNAEAHNYLGIVLSQKGWGAAGEQEIRRAIELNPQYADAHFNLAVVYAKQRTPKTELARYHYKKALDLGAPPDPDLEALLKKLSEKPAVPNAGGPIKQ
jgi:Flp pilus assembly protein TadD/uncharacterized coiled-coil DUF342 family protein